MELHTLWFCLVAVLWIGYFALEGFDFGVGMLLPILAKDEKEKRVLYNTIGPVWDGNEVWVLTAGGAIFASFPFWYATLFSGFFLPLLLFLIALIVRNLAFDLNRRLTLENRHPASEDELQGLPSENPSPECEALYSDELQRLQDAMTRLPERSRQAFVMHRLHGMTFKDIALRLGISTSLAHQLVRDALTFCSEQLSDD